MTTESDDDAKPLCWRSFIVDDEPDVHRATTFALNGVHILGRPIEFLHAYSAQEAIEILKAEHGIAIILLDVVMEREDAGLNLVKTIRGYFICWMCASFCAPVSQVMHPRLRPSMTMTSMTTRPSRS